jgi:hypothetical protein
MQKPFETRRRGVSGGIELPKSPELPKLPKIENHTRDHSII